MKSNHRLEFAAAPGGLPRQPLLRPFTGIAPASEQSGTGQLREAVKQDTADHRGPRAWPLPVRSLRRLPPHRSAGPVSLSRSGSHTRTIQWSASADMAPYVGGYYLQAIEAAGEEPHVDAFPPGAAHLRVLVSGGVNWRVRPAGGDWVEPEAVSLFGPTRAVTWSESGTGVWLGAVIRPRGWLRLLDQPARVWAGRIEGAPTLGQHQPQELRAALGRLNDENSIPDTFERFLREAMAPMTADEASVGRMEAALLDPSIGTVREMSEVARLSLRSLERLASRTFGFSPKLLLRRARFLRSLDAVRGAPPCQRAWSIDPSYTDYSHFIRDSHDFLGLAPQAFLKMNLQLGSAG